MTSAELRQKSVEELEKELLELMKEQFNNRMQQSTGQLSRTHLLKQGKRSIARVKTVLREKKVSQ